MAAILSRPQCVKYVFILGQWPQECFKTRESGPWFNIKMSSYQYRKSHCGDKTVVRSSYLHNVISYTGKMSSLYWICLNILQHELIVDQERGLVQRAPLSFQTSIPHKVRQVKLGEVQASVVTEWPPAYVWISYSQEDIKHQLQKTSNGRFS